MPERFEGRGRGDHFAWPEGGIVSRRVDADDEPLIREQFMELLGARSRKGRLPRSGKILKGPVALVGYMGSGKSTVGRSLADRLGREFADLDEEIERRDRRSIPDIFASSGEKRFRELEHETLRDVVERDEEYVVSCGGGIVVLAENRALLKQTRTVFLEEDLDLLFGRTRGAGRPLRGGDREEFERRYTERLPLYREVAGLTVFVGGRSQEDVLEEVERWLVG